MGVNTVEAASLAAIPSPTQAVWHLGPVPLRAYAVCIVLGMAAAAVVTEIRLRRRGAPPYTVLDIMVWAVPCGIIGARAYHVLTSPDRYFGPGGNPTEALFLWRPGLGIWGAVVGGALGAWISARKLGIPLAVVADALAPGLPLAQAIGRWGNWFNNELYGSQTSLPWGLRVHAWNLDEGRATVDSAGTPRVLPGLYHPTFLYESLWCLAVAVLVWRLDRRLHLSGGRAFALYVMAYTAGRFWIEALRIDSAHEILGMRLNNWTSIVVFLAALLYFLRARRPPQQLTADEPGTVQVTDVATDQPTTPAGHEPAKTDPLHDHQ